MGFLLCVFAPSVEFTQRVIAKRLLPAQRQAAPLAVGVEHQLKHHLTERPEILVVVEIDAILSS